MQPSIYPVGWRWTFLRHKFIQQKALGHLLNEFLVKCMAPRVTSDLYARACGLFFTTRPEASADKSDVTREAIH